MTWLVLGLAAAALQAGRLAVIKQVFGDLSPGQVTSILSLSCAALSVPLLFLGEPLPLRDAGFWALTLAGSLAAGCGALAVNAALREGELSRVGPLLGITPLIVAVIEGLVHGTWPSALGMVGITCIVACAWWMARAARPSDATSEPGHPRRAIHRGAGKAMTGAVCFALAITLGREGVLRSDALAFAGLIALLSPPVTLLVCLRAEPDVLARLRRVPPRRLLHAAVVLGGMFALMRLCDLMALELALGSYVSAVKRSAGLFSVVIGVLVLREDAGLAKLACALGIVLGIYLLQAQG